MHPDLVQATNEFDAVSNDLGETNHLVPAGECGLDRGAAEEPRSAEDEQLQPE